MFRLSAVFIATALATTASWADVTVGVIYSATGPVAAAGIAEQRTIAILPKTLGGERAVYVGLDDAGDTAATVRAARKLLSDNKIDVLLGPTSSANSLAILEAMATSETPMISLAGSASIVTPVEGTRRWAFKTPQSDSMMASVIVQHMAKSGVKTLAVIAFNDVYGEGWTREITRYADAAKIRIVSVERYERNDASVTGQVLKTMAAHPDAVFIGAAGTPAVLPQAALVERGYKGPFYQTHGTANAEFLRLGGKSVENTFVPLAPGLVAEQLPDSNPAKKPALEFIRQYEAIPGAGTRSPFAAYLWDAALVLDKAVAAARTHAKPGTVEFRRALRDAVEGVRNLPAFDGVYDMSPTDHLGLDQRGRVMTQIRQGTWKLVD